VAKGRPPDPGRAKRGTGHRPLPGKAKPAEVVPTAGLDLTPPPSIPAEAHELWHRACAELAGKGLCEADLPLVEMLVVAAHRNRQARAIVGKIDLLVKGEKGPVVNPLLKVEKDTAATYLRLAETLGLSPAARARLGLMHIAGQSLLVDIAERVRRVSEGR
jgi:P27 family predicted phage terminase small subunit